jgi:hypothetical protein
MRTPTMLIAAVLAASSLGVASAASALVPADVTLTAGPVSTVVSVSPDIFYDAASATYFLFTTGPGTGAPPTPGAPSIGIYSSKDGASWSPVPGASTPSGAFSDPSVIAMGKDTYRMYVTSKSGTAPGCTGKQLRYATSTDLRNWTMQPQILVDDIGCGVPQVVAGPEGYRLYYVSFGASVPRKGECSPDPSHGVYMRESKDGLVWSAVSPRIAPTDMVDPSVVQLPDGSWLMLTADFSQCPTPGFSQKLYVGTSSDGLTWDFGNADPLYAADAGQGAFDPDAVVLPDGSVRAWWSQGTSAEAARVTVGDVTVTPTPDPEPVVPVPPTKPKATWTSKALKVAWTYAVGAAAPESFAVQVRTTGSWATVATVAGDRAATSVSRAKLPKSAFSVRVVAIIGDEEAASPSTKVAKAR